MSCFNCGNLLAEPYGTGLCNPCFAAICAEPLPGPALAILAQYLATDCYLPEAQRKRILVLAIRLGYESHLRTLLQQQAAAAKV